MAERALRFQGGVISPLLLAGELLSWGSCLLGRGGLEGLVSSRAALAVPEVVNVLWERGASAVCL